MVVKPIIPKRFSFWQLSLSRQMMWAGVAITVLYVAIALFAPLLQQVRLLQDPTASLINPIHEPPFRKLLVWHHPPGLRRLLDTYSEPRPRLKWCCWPRR